jgi:RNA polymerase sigma-70 factor (family 1)
MSKIAAERIQYLQTRIARFEDQSAYRELFITLYPSLYHFTNGFLRSKESAEEIVSDVFIRIWQKRAELETIRHLKVYCFVAARNLSLNLLEKQKSESTVGLDDFETELKSSYSDPEQMMITEEMMKRIHKAIGDLPLKCRMIFNLIKEDGFKYQETAEIMNISVKTVENQLAIALKKIGKSIHFDIKRAIQV